MKRLFTLAVVFLASIGIAAAQNKVIVKDGTETIRYNKMIFGHFIEHFHKQIYGGIYDPESRFADEDGFRTDVIEAMKQIKVPIVRWPGGCFVSSYHWLDGVGPERQPTFDKAWQVEDPNTFGTDEFVKWCRKVGCEPFICTNAGTGTEEEMSDWVEYCNLSVGKWGRMRMDNGYVEPHDVKYWSVGNENWGGHEIGAKTDETWGPFVREAAKMMRCVNHDLKLFAAAIHYGSWTLPLLKTAGQHLDYVSIHGYWDSLDQINNPSSYIDCMMRTERPKDNIDATIKILKKAGYGDGQVKIAFDEWNLRGWHHPGFGRHRQKIDVDIDNSAFKGIEAIILSMTPYEREHPECLNGSRRKRIADGSGTSLPEVNKLLKQFEGTRKMMKTVMGANMGNMMRGGMRGMKRR